MTDIEKLDIEERNKKLLEAMKWWNTLTDNEKNNYVLHYSTSSIQNRNHSTLTGREITMIHKLFLQN
jgi:hypothetical protein